MRKESLIHQKNPVILCNKNSAPILTCKQKRFKRSGHCTKNATTNIASWYLWHRASNGHTVRAWQMSSITILYAFSVSMHLGVVTDGFYSNFSVYGSIHFSDVSTFVLTKRYFIWKYLQYSILCIDYLHSYKRIVYEKMWSLYRCLACILLVTIRTINWENTE